MMSINDTIRCVNHDCDKCKAVQEPRARLMKYIGKGQHPKQGHTVVRTYEECPKNYYPDDWEEGEKLYTAPPAAQPHNNAVLLELLSRALPMVAVAYSRGFVDAEAIGRDIEEALGIAPEKGQP